MIAVNQSTLKLVEKVAIDHLTVARCLLSTKMQKIEKWVLCELLEPNIKQHLIIVPDTKKKMEVAMKRLLLLMKCEFTMII